MMVNLLTFFILGFTMNEGSILSLSELMIEKKRQ